ncbi:Mitochondrial distribution and morphology protein 31 [Penicillium subrubescens]|uniref:Mitochondrial distribution and morphology protein 31 n=1 Tax=Penicillium subrubescens TaxID=1316194 RepID=A0A1Q5U7W9_9EURO|nr:Mitochondrial distribution and morphology protein 31 [Penicillium subrubescens]KAJ5911246.1 Mitochondrial distribution and morphology protein 31 [Penicillium subrubescens]OKP08589.1 Mitochondrial distribution and morphology protein 31 [Penicillium subrubescens]
MSANFGRRLYAHLWESAHPFLGRIRPNRVPGPDASSRTAFDSIFANHRRLSSAPGKPTQLTRRFASGGFLVLVSPSSTAAETSAACIIPSKKLTAQYIWKRALHTPNDRLREGASSKDSKSPKDDEHPQKVQKTDDHSPPHSSPSNASQDSPPSTSSSTPPHRHHLMDRLPHMPHVHRPTKEELLAAATGFWSRLKVRFKWFSIRSVRPYNLDEITALFSWVLLGHVVWVVVGTTTFFSLLILAINTVFAQETLAGWVGNYLTKSSGVKVVFESAIVPKWRGGVITFKNVFVSRRPGQGTGYVSKGSPTTAAAAAAAAARGEHENGSEESAVPEEEDTNYTQFDLSIETVNVTLSFTKWLNGKGPLRDVEVKGIRGVVDRRHVWWPAEDLDPLSYRHEHNPGDFEIDSFKMHDVLVSIYQPDNFRPFSVSIFSCDLPQLRRQWLFYDFLSANMMSGSFDNSLFTIHPRQTHGFTGARLEDGMEEDGKPSPWKKHNRIRVDGLNIDHLNRGVQGPFSWIHEGTVDIVADIMLPVENDESIAKVMADFYDRLEATVTSNQYTETLSQRSQKDPESLSEADKRFIAMDLRVNLNNVRAAVPIFTRDLSYINNALIRPIVAYINSKRTFIPINCRLVKRASDFDGSWTIFDSGLMDDLSAATYDAFARDVVDDEARKRRFKKVGFWSLQLAAQAIFIGMAGNIA